jgi:hypothetical protein
MPCCDTGRNIQKYKGAAASTLQDVTDNGNTTTGDIITTSGFFIGDGSKLTGISGASAAFTLQETTDRGNTTSNVVQFTNTITSLTTSGNVIVAGNVTASNFYGDGTTLDGVALSVDLTNNVTRISILESNLADNVTRIGNLESNLADNVTRIGNLESNLTNNSTRISILESNLADNVTRIGNLESNLTNNSTRISILESNLADNVTRIGNLESNLADNVTRISILESNLTNNSTRISILESNLVSNASRISALENETQPVTRGGTNITTYAKGDILIALATNTLSNLGLGQSGYVLTSNSTTTLPEWRSASDIGTTVKTLNTGNYLAGGPYNGSSVATFNVEGTTTNTPSNLVARDSIGDIYVQRVIVGTGSTGTLSSSAWSGSAAKLTTARTIGGVSFDGSADINLPGVNTPGDQNTSGSAAKLTTPITIGGVSFDGSEDINLPGVNTPGNQNTSGSAAKISVSDSTSSSQLPLPFMSAATGNDVTLYSDSGALQYQASTGTLSSTHFSGSGTSLTDLNATNINSGTLSNAYGGTGFTSYAKGDLLVGTGSGSNLKKLPIGSASDVLTVSEGTVSWRPASGGTGSSVWTQLGNQDIYYNSGNVGIQTNTPQYELDVSGNVNITQKLLVNGTPGITGNVLGINSTSSGLEWVKAPDKVKVTANDTSTGQHKIIFSLAPLSSDGETKYIDLNSQSLDHATNDIFSFTPSESLLKVGVIRTGGNNTNNSISNLNPTHTLHVGDKIIMHNFANYDVFRVNGNVFTTGHFVGDGSYITGIKQIKNETDTDVIVAGDGAPTRRSLLSRFYN